MAGNSFGNIFKLTTFGESHGPALGGVIDGCPPGIKLDLDLLKVKCKEESQGNLQLLLKEKKKILFNFTVEYLRVRQLVRQLDF